MKQQIWRHDFDVSVHKHGTANRTIYHITLWVDGKWVVFEARTVDDLITKVENAGIEIVEQIPVKGDE